MKPLALGLKPEGPFILPTKRTLIDHSYPLSRTLPAVVDKPPGRPLDPKVREFLRYLLSREGQEAVNEDGRYLPLAPDFAEMERRKIE